MTLDHGLAGKRASVRPHISVLIDYPTLMSLATTAGAAHQINPAQLISSPPVGGPINPSSLDPAVLNRTGLSPAVLNPAVFEDGQVVTRVVLGKLTCDAEISRFMFAPDSQRINIGRAKRTFTGQLRRAIIARDKHCQFPRCTAPPRMCEGHHSKHWLRDQGDTDARSGVLLCWHHHDYVHDNGIEITWKPGGGWQFTDHHGTTLHR